MSLYKERPGGLRVEQLEASHAYLAREHRILNLRGPVFGAFLVQAHVVAPFLAAPVVYPIRV